MAYSSISHHCLNTLRPRQNGRHFPDDIFKCIFLNENVWISLEISLKFVPKVRVNNIPTLVQIMAWRRPGDKPLHKQCWLVYWHMYASFGLNEFMKTRVEALVPIYAYVAALSCTSHACHLPRYHLPWHQDSIVFDIYIYHRVTIPRNYCTVYQGGSGAYV